MEYKFLLAGFTYLVSSVITTLANKYILVTLNFQMHYLMVSLQSYTIVLSLTILHLTGLLKIESSKMRQWCIPSLFLTTMIFTGSKSLFYLPVSLYTVFKNCSIILIAIGERFLFQRFISLVSYFSFILMILSSYVGDASDFTLNIGYAWMLLNILATAGYVLVLKMRIEDHRNDVMGSVYYTNLIAIPILLLLSAIFDAPDRKIFELSIIGWILLSSICAFVTSYSTSLTLHCLSSITLSMLGALNKSVVSIGGIVMFSESKNVLKIISLVGGIFSTLVYSLDVSRKSNSR